MQKVERMGGRGKTSSLTGENCLRDAQTRHFFQSGKKKTQNWEKKDVCVCVCEKSYFQKKKRVAVLCLPYPPPPKSLFPPFFKQEEACWVMTTPKEKGRVHAVE